MKYLIILTSPSHHFMNEPQDYFEPYVFKANNEKEFNNCVEYAERLFVKKYNVSLVNVQHLLTYKVK